MFNLCENVNRKHIAIAFLIIMCLLLEAFLIISLCGWQTDSILLKTSWAKDDTVANGSTFIGLQGFFINTTPPLWKPFSSCSDVLEECSQCLNDWKVAFILLLISYFISVILSVTTILRGGYFYIKDSYSLKYLSMSLSLVVIIFTAASFINWVVNCFPLIKTDGKVTIQNLTVTTGWITALIASILAIFLLFAHLVTPVVWDHSETYSPQPHSAAIKHIHSEPVREHSNVPTISTTVDPSDEITGKNTSDTLYKV